MKKMLFWAVLSLISVKTFAAQDVISACYIVDSHGKIGLKIVSPSSGIGGMHVWLSDGSSSYDPCTFIIGSIVQDDDGINWDYSYQTNTTISINDLTSFYFQMPCYTIYYTTGGGIPPNLPAVQACPCKSVTGGCFTDDGRGNYLIKLVFTTAYYNAMHGEITPAIIGRAPHGYLVPFLYYVLAGYSDPAGDPNSWVPEGDHYAVYYTIPTSYFTLDANGCTTISYESLIFDVGGEGASDPLEWPVTQSVQICPCCNPATLSVTATTSTSGSWLTQSFSSSMIANWDFGDGFSGHGINVSHTYAGAGTYLVCANSTQGDGTPCSVCHAFCLADPHPSGISGGPASPCDADFWVTVSPFGNITVNSVLSYLTGTYSYDFGDGSGIVTGTDGYMTHTYASSGTYTICVHVAVTHSTVGVGCYRCMTICVDVDGPKPGSTTPPAPLQPLAESLVIAPNPAANSASIMFDLDKAADVRVIITDALGKVVRDFTNNAMTAGRQHLDINTSSFPAGVYNVSVKTDKGSITKRLSVLR